MGDAWVEVRVLRGSASDFARLWRHVRQQDVDAPTLSTFPVFGFWWHKPVYDRAGLSRLFSRCGFTGKLKFVEYDYEVHGDGPHETGLPGRWTGFSASKPSTVKKFWQSLILKNSEG